jgi:hypothetical protein
MRHRHTAVVSSRDDQECMKRGKERRSDGATEGQRGSEEGEEGGGGPLYRAAPSPSPAAVRTT